MSLFGRLIHRKCRTCKGKGKWTEREEDKSTGLTEVVVKVCSDCNGTGRSGSVEDDEDFDFDGKGFGEEDDD